MKNFTYKNNEHGFTIVELLVATTVFSVILVLISVGVLQIGRSYIKGVTMTRTQEAARTIIEDISRAIQFSGGKILPDHVSGASGNVTDFCIDNIKFVFQTGKQLKKSGTLNPDQSSTVLMRNNSPSCTPTSLPSIPTWPAPSPDTKELMIENARLAELTLDKIQNTESYRISITIAYGDSDLLSPDFKQCITNNNSGGQFCAVSTLTTTVQKRVK